MAKVSDIRRYPDKHRLYEPLNDVQVLVSALQIAMAKETGLTEPNAGRFNCLQCDFAIAIPLGAALQNAIKEVRSPFVEIGRTPPSNPDVVPVVEGKETVETTGLSQVI